MKLEVVNAIYTIIIWQSFLFGVLLFTPKYNKVSGNKFLAFNLLGIGVQFIINSLFINNYINQLPLNICSYGYLYGPLLFFYVKFTLRKEVVFRGIDFLHFSPFVSITLFSVFNIDVCNIMADLLLPTMFVYFTLTLRDIIIYKKTIPQVSTNIGRSEINWLLILLIVSILNVIISLIYENLTPNITFFGNTIRLSFFVIIGVLLFVNLIIFQGLKNPKFFQQISSEDIDIAKSAIPLNIAKSNFSNIEQLEALSNKLEDHMNTNRVFMDAELNLSSLAEILNVHPKTLSQSINNIFESNFSDYINSYRIDASKKLLIESDTSIKEIMFEVGFNSRSVFNTLFKKRTGLTPSQYRDKHTNS